jgi:hypothetical protein
MAMPRANEGDGFIALVRETADGLGRLIADHIKLARVEMVADAKEASRRMALLAGAAAVIGLGYLFLWIAVALALRRPLGAPLAFVIVGGLHVTVGVIVLVALVRRLRRGRVLNQTVSEVGRTVTALRAQVTGPESDSAAGP